MKQRLQIDDTATQRLQKALSYTANILHIRPNSGRLWLDTVYLLVIGAVHLSIAPVLLKSTIDIDLMTPWLVVSFVTESFWRATFLGFVGALILETHTGTAAGFYMCSYWVILVVLALVRTPLSWRHRFPWLVTFAAAELWVIGFECFVRAVNSTWAMFDLAFLIDQILRLLIAVGFGLLLVRRWSSLDPSLFDEEEMPV
jgi:hypothetical protein